MSKAWEEQYKNHIQTYKKQSSFWTWKKVLLLAFELVAIIGLFSFIFTHA